MSVTEGLVEAIGNSKFGDDKRLNLGGKWYSVSPELVQGVNKGATVKIAFELKGKSTLVVSKLKVLEAAPPQPSGGGNRGGWGGKKKDNSDEIHYQSSRKDALAYIQLEHETGVLALGSKSKEVKAQLLRDRLDTLTAEFYEDITSKGAVQRYKDQADESDEFEPEEETPEPDPSIPDEPFGDDDFGDDDDPF